MMAHWGFLFLLLFAAGCSSKPGTASGGKHSSQHFVDVTKAQLPTIAGEVKFGLIGHFTRGKKRDILLVTREGDGPMRFSVLIQDPTGGKFSPVHNPNLERLGEKEVVDVVISDLNNDRVDDLVVIGKEADGLHAHLLLSNKKGYFYELPNAPTLPLAPDMEQVEAVDIDNDHDIDLLFLKKSGGGDRSQRQAQLFVNNGQGGFQDLTASLLPPLDPGIANAALADYDDDGYIDIFLVYAKGQNALLINNGLGKFASVAHRALPRVIGRHNHSDWADFDNDKDNDILVVAEEIDKEFRDHPTEHCYFLENDGHGRFRKRALGILPTVPSQRVYLLDADKNDLVDMIILTREGPHFYSGAGPWAFSLETRTRLPMVEPIDKMAFGDINGDGYLDILAILSKNKKAVLWMSSVN
jgi:hypothetical protein